MISNPYTPESSISTLGLKGRLRNKMALTALQKQNKTYISEFSAMTLCIYLRTLQSARTDS